MSKKLIYTIIGLVVVVGGGYFLFNSGSSNDVTGTPNDGASAGKKMAFSQFIKQGGAWKCDVKQMLSDMDNSGTVYIGDGKVAGMYHTIAEGRPMDTSFILKDGYSYSWTSLFPTMGFKTQMSPSSGGDATAGSSGTYDFNAEQIGDYNCEPWTVDQSVFALPAGITFKDVGTK